MLARAFFVVLLLLSVSARAASSYQVDSGATVAITEHSVCAVVTNNHASGLALFVPTGSAGEWNAFRTSPGAGVNAVACDTTPDVFSFSDVTDATLSTLTVSNSITIVGINAAAAVSVSGGEVRINNGSWGTSGNINSGDTLEVRLTSSGSNSTAVSATVTVGGVSDSWSVTTAAGSMVCPDGGVLYSTGPILSIPGSRLAKLNATTFAAFDVSASELKTYQVSGSSFLQIGSALSLNPPSGGAIAAMSATTVALINVGDETLGTYSWNGSSWSHVGSDLSVATSGTEMTALDATTIAVIDGGNEALVAYTWNGSDWSAAGSISVPGEDYSLATLDSTTVAVMVGNGGSLLSYKWNGSSWSLLGSGDINNYGTGMAALTSSLVAVSFDDDDGLEEIRTYKWSGSTWTQVGNTVPIPNSLATFIGLNSSEFYYLNDSVMQKYGVACGSGAPDSTAPVWTTASGTIATYDIGDSVNTSVVGTDNSGDVVFIKQSGDDSIWVDGQTGAIQGTPSLPGKYALSIRLSDLSGNYVDRSFTVVVKPEPGCAWSYSTGLPATSWWSSVSYGNGLFAAVASGATMTSPDGVSWTSRGSMGSLVDVIYANGQFAAIGMGGAAATSSNGTSWSSTSQGFSTSYNAIAYGNGKYVAVGGDPTYRAATSSNGTSWTRNAALGGTWWDIAFGNGIFVAVGTASGGPPLRTIMTSTDGVNWTLRDTPSAIAGLDTVTYGGGKFVAIGNFGRMTESTDGINWTYSGYLPYAGWKSVSYGNGLYVAVGSGGARYGVVTSPDGVNWTIREGQDGSWSSVVYGGGKFVAVNRGAGSTTQVMKSACDDIGG